MSASHMRSSVSRVAVIAAGMIAMIASMVSTNTLAVPAFSRQTGKACSSCHTVMPELTAYGRQFKLGGFASGDELEAKAFPFNLPLSAVLAASVNTTRSTDGVDPDMITRDGKASLQVAGVYYAGRIAENFGALAQYNYDGIERKWGVEMVDVRYANSMNIGTRELNYGITVNNNPTLADIYNSTPMWSFPHFVSDKTVMPAASSVIDMTLFGQVGGVGAYAFWDNLLYGEVAFYRNNQRGLLRPLGAGLERTVAVKGSAPYWRFAAEQKWGPHTVEIGTFGMIADIYPDPDDTSTPTNRFKDFALDAQYHYISGAHILSTHAVWIREKQQWNASFASGATSNSSDVLRTFRADAHYFYDRRFGGGVSYFATTGDKDQLKYDTGEAVTGSIAGSPETRGWAYEVNYLPLENVKLGLRYTAFKRFNGGTSDYDGFGRNAKDNNTMFLYAWMLF